MPKNRPTISDLLVELEKLQRQNEGLRQTNLDLELLLAEKSNACEKMKRELEDLLATQIRVEASARESEEKYKTLISNIPGVVYRCANDSAWSMRFISDSIEELCGYPASDFLNNAVRTYASIIFPDDVVHVVECVQKGLRDRKPYLIEYRIRHNNGTIRWVHEKGQGVFDNGGEFLWLDGVIFDITDRVPDA
jgi:PAS domain S-box-containing protein